MSGTTAFLGLGKPPAGSTGYDVTLNGNFDTLDGAIQTLTVTPLGPSNNVPYSAYPSFDLGKASTHHIVLTGDVTAPTFSNPRDGQLYIVVIEQDAVGGRTFTFPASFVLADNINPASGNAAASSRCVQVFVWLNASSKYIKIAPTLYG